MSRGRKRAQSSFSKYCFPGTKKRLACYRIAHFSFVGDWHSFFKSTAVFYKPYEMEVQRTLLNRWCTAFHHIFRFITDVEWIFSSWCIFCTGASTWSQLEVWAGVDVGQWAAQFHKEVLESLRGTTIDESWQMCRRGSTNNLPILSHAHFTKSCELCSFKRLNRTLIYLPLSRLRVWSLDAAVFEDASLREFIF